MNYKQRLERYRGDFESILELLDNVEIRVNNSNLITIQAICEERIKEIEDLIKHNNDFKKLDNLEMYRRFAYSKKGKNILKEAGLHKIIGISRNNNKFMTEKLFFMEIADKIVLSKERCCPPHYLPHKLPLGRPVDNESCHTHIASWRRAHHDTFCKILRCPHYQFMIDESGKLNEQ